MSINSFDTSILSQFRIILVSVLMINDAPVLMSERTNIWFSQNYEHHANRFLVLWWHRMAISPYTGCFMRNLPYFGSVFLRLVYIDITENTNIQIWTVKGLMELEKSDYLAVPHTAHTCWVWCVIHTLRRSILDPMNRASPYGGKCATWSTWSLKDDFYVTITSFTCWIKVQISLRC